LDGEIFESLDPNGQSSEPDKIPGGSGLAPTVRLTQAPGRSVSSDSLPQKDTIAPTRIYFPEDVQLADSGFLAPPAIPTKFSETLGAEPLKGLKSESTAAPMQMTMCSPASSSAAGAGIYSPIWHGGQDAPQSRGGVFAPQSHAGVYNPEDHSQHNVNFAPNNSQTDDRVANITQATPLDQNLLAINAQLQQQAISSAAAAGAQEAQAQNKQEASS